MKRKILAVKLDPYEQMLEDNFEKSMPVKHVSEEVRMFKKSAEQHLRGNKRITIRVYDQDLDRIKQLASKEGLPYQTFITSALHRLCMRQQCRPV